MNEQFVITSPGMVRPRSSRLGDSSIALQAGLHRNYVGACERGEINLSFGSLLRFLDALGASFLDLAAWPLLPSSCQPRSSSSRKSSAKSLASFSAAGTSS